MKQVVDLEGSPEFQKLGVELLSIATDETRELSLAAQEWRTQTPLLSDLGAKVSQRYVLSQWFHGKEPGHVFVLVAKDGKVRWIRDYGAAENGGRMYVPVDELVQEVAQRLPRQ
jgi:peroxiredoxin